jgi:hypothetical protein
VHQDPVTSRALELDGINVSFVCVLPRSSSLPLKAMFFQEHQKLKVHNEVTEELLCKVLLNHPNPWSHQQFNAFCDGFNLHFLDLSKLVMVRKKRLSHEHVLTTMMRYSLRNQSRDSLLCNLSLPCTVLA